MFINTRNESLEIMLFRSLHLRSKLSEKDGSYYLSLEKGFQGERIFDKWMENLNVDCLILNDLLLEINNNIFQIDSLLITQKTIYLFEVKNYDGDYYVEGDSWYTIFRTEIKNPLLQLKRSESLFRRLLKDLGFSFSIESYLIFVNPDFYLYQTPLNVPIIFPTQINRFINKINSIHSKISNGHIKLSNQLMSVLLKESPYSRLPKYDYDQLKKGIPCLCCHSLITESNKRDLICKMCNSNECIDSAILRSVEEYSTLFPDEKITTNTIYEWCGELVSRKTIRKILANNFKSLGYAKSTHYVKNI